MQALRAKGISVKFDNDDQKKPGWKFAEYELKGAPVRIAVGPRDMENGTVEVARRDTMEKQVMQMTDLPEKIEHLLQAETSDRAMRSVNYQMGAAKFPVHRDLAGFDLESSRVDRALIEQLAGTEFTELAHNAVFIGGPGTGKTHLATAIGVAGITRHSKRVRFYSTVDLVNALEQEKVQGLSLIHI